MPKNSSALKLTQLKESHRPKNNSNVNYMYSTYICKRNICKWTSKMFILNNSVESPPWLWVLVGNITKETNFLDFEPQMNVNSFV